MVIHTFGDSHSHFGFNKIPNIYIHHLGPILCYTFGNKKLDILNIKHHGINENDSVIFCFGEIDCRAHIYRHVNENNSYKNIIDNIVKNYIEAIMLNIKQYQNIKVVIYNVVPPGNVNNQHTNEEIQKYVLTKNKNDIPWKGSNEERKKYHLYFNKKLNDYCQNNNIIFMDIYNKYCNENGFLNDILSDKSVHIDDPIYIEEFLINNSI